MSTGTGERGERRKTDAKPVRRTPRRNGLAARLADAERELAEARREAEARSRELEDAVRRQTAAGDILRAAGFAH